MALEIVLAKTRWYLRWHKGDIQFSYLLHASTIAFKWPRDTITCARDSFDVRTRICIPHLDPDRYSGMNSSTPRVYIEHTAVRDKWFFEIARPRRPFNDLSKKIRRPLHTYFIFIRNICM
jgi:hypothetical protein